MSTRIVIIAGATGLVGRELLAGLLQDPGVSEVHSLGRKAPTQTHPKLVAHQVDFGRPLESQLKLPPCDEAYLALGTTIKVAGSQAAFRAVDFDANLAVARAALAAGASRMGLVSAMGADSGSRVFYSRVKGDLEAALSAMPLTGLVIARPSLLVGDREALGQPRRSGESIGFLVGRVFDLLIPADYKPITARQVAQALLHRVPAARGPLVLRSGALRRLAQ